MKLNGTALKISLDALVDFVSQCHVPEFVRKENCHFYVNADSHSSDLEIKIIVILWASVL